MSLRTDLKQFIGSAYSYSHSLNRQVIVTEGVFYFAEKAGAHWFLDILATEPAILKQQKEFALVTLIVTGTTAKITVTDGNDDNASVFVRDIEFTDCPEGDWRFYFVQNVIMLPSEY